MTAVKRDLSIEQGATFTMGFYWGTGVNTTTTPHTIVDPYLPESVRMQIRKVQGSPVLIDAYSATVIIGDTVGEKPMIELSGTGQIKITIPASETNKLNIPVAVYDIEATLPELLPNDQPDVRRLYMGSVTISPNVTQSP